MVAGLVGGILSEILLVAAILLVLYIIFKLGKFILGLIVNVILGFVAIFVLNGLFALGINFDLITIIVTALTGLPGVAVIVILKLLGISI